MVDTDSKRLPVNRKLLKRIFSKIRVSTVNFYKGTPCWEWTGRTDKGGYAVMDNRSRGWTQLVHRLVYQLIVEIIPDDLESDHLCRNRPCIRPDHIEPVTKQINCLRGESFAAHKARQTHCHAGHPLSGSNLKTTKKGRECRECVNYAERQRIKKVRAELPYDHPQRKALRDRYKRWYESRGRDHIRRKRAKSL